MDDKHIVAQARRGELSAFEELVTRYEKRVYAIALRSSGSPEDAADITQEVFLRAWRSMKDFRGDSGFATWLFRITMNQCVDYARHKQSQPPTQPLVKHIAILEARRHVNCYLKRESGVKTFKNRICALTKLSDLYEIADELKAFVSAKENI